MSAVKAYLNTIRKAEPTFFSSLCVRLRMIEAHTNRQSDNALSPICLPKMPITAI